MKDKRPGPKASFPTLRARLAHYLALGAVVGLGAWFRFADLGGAPLWFPDECAAVGQADGFPRFPLVWDGVRHSFFPGQPLGLLAQSGAIRLWGRDLLSLRRLSALAGMAALLAVYCIGLQAGPPGLGLLAALAFALHPLAINLCRMGLSESLGAALSLWGVWGGLALMQSQRIRSRPAGAEAEARRGRPRGAAPGGSAVAALGLMLAPFAALSAVPNAVGFCLLGPGSRRRGLLMAGLYVAGLALALGLWSRFGAGGLYFEDFRMWLEQGGGLGVSGAAMFERLGQTLTETGGVSTAGFGGWTILGAGGLLLLRRRCARRALPALAALNLAFVAAISLAREDLVLRHALPLLGLTSVGLAAAVLELGTLGARQLGAQMQWMAQKLAAAPPFARRPNAEASACRAVRLAALGAGLALAFLAGSHLAAPYIYGIPRAFRREMDREAIARTAELYEARDWLAARVGPDDLIVAEGLEWLMPGRTTSLFYAAAASGALAPGRTPKDFGRRIVEDIRLEKARYLVLHPAVNGLCRRVPELRRAIEPFLAQEPACSLGMIRIYASPSRGE